MSASIPSSLRASWRDLCGRGALRSALASPVTPHRQSARRYKLTPLLGEESANLLELPISLLRAAGWIVFRCKRMCESHSRYELRDRRSGLSASGRVAESAYVPAVAVLVGSPVRALGKQIPSDMLHLREAKQ